MSDQRLTIHYMLEDGGYQYVRHIEGTVLPDDFFKG
jgi:hypothetical protein